MSCPFPIATEWFLIFLRGKIILALAKASLLKSNHTTMLVNITFSGIRLQKYFSGKPLCFIMLKNLIFMKIRYMKMLMIAL